MNCQKITNFLIISDIEVKVLISIFHFEVQYSRSRSTAWVSSLWRRITRRRDCDITFWRRAGVKERPGIRHIVFIVRRGGRVRRGTYVLKHCGWGCSTYGGHSTIRAWHHTVYCSLSIESNNEMTDELQLHIHVRTTPVFNTKVCNLNYFQEQCFKSIALNREAIKTQNWLNSHAERCRAF
jgi:hypothetical protein